MYREIRTPCLGTRCLCRAKLTSSNDPVRKSISPITLVSQLKEEDLVIDLKLIFENSVPLLVDTIRLITIVFLPSINWTPLSIPNTKTTLIHPLSFLLITPSQPPLLFITADVLLRRTGETKDGVIMDGICSIFPFLVAISKVREIGCKGVTIKEQSVISVHCSNGFINTIIEIDDASLVWIGRFIQRIIARDPGVVLVVLGEFFP